MSNLLLVPNPFTSSAKEISDSIAVTHGPQIIPCNVNSIYDFVSDYVKVSTKIDESPVIQYSKGVVLKQDSVSSLMPELRILKDVACEMRCSTFDKATAHNIVVEILMKLRNYSWDAKAVIALSAFAMVFGETWRLSRIVRPKDDKSPSELHIFRFWEEEKTSQTYADLTKLVTTTLDLIKNIIELEKHRAKNCLNRKDVPALSTADPAPFSYWAILALITCANRKTEADRSFIIKVSWTIQQASATLIELLQAIENEMKLAEDLNKRLKIIQSPNGILELLKALILPDFSQSLEIVQYTAGNAKRFTKMSLLIILTNPVSDHDLTTKNLLLFISGLYDIQNEISDLKSIPDELKSNKYQILWIPIGKKYDEEEKEKYNAKISEMSSWYGLKELFMIRGKRALERDWHYQGKPMLLVTNPQGHLVHINALYLISILGRDALPFGPEKEKILFMNWNWFWKPASEISSQIDAWVNPTDKPTGYTVIYGGTNTKEFDTLLSKINGLNSFKLAKADDAKISEFWRKIKISFLTRVQNFFEEDSVLQDIQALLSYENLDGSWAILSKGKKVLFNGHFSMMDIVLKKFMQLKPDQLEKPDEVISLCTPEKPSSLKGIPCFHFQLSNIGSTVPFSMACPMPYCHRTMNIQTVKYNCCHGNDEIVPVVIKEF